jgi:dephospho-CoA kinase
MLRVGVTGPAGAGKTTVARGLEARGFPRLDADRMAHALYVPGSPLVRAIAAELGAAVLDARGGIDRAALGRLVFADARARAALDAIVHPALIAAIRDAQQAQARAGVLVSVLDAALLLQWSASHLVDVVVGVLAPRGDRLRRLRALGLAREDAERRLDLQVAEEDLRRSADLLVENGESREALETRIEELARILRRRAEATGP